jgi:ribonuclease G
MFNSIKKRSKQIIINAEHLETRVAVLKEDKLDDFYIERSTEERLVGSIFKGKIQNLEDGLQAAFIDIGMKKNAFIHYWDMIPEDTDRLEKEEGVTSSRQGRRKKFTPGEMAKKFPVGSEIVVQVTKGAIGTKGPRVTASLSLPGRYLVMMPGSRLKGVSRKIEDAKERQRLKKVLARLPIPQDIGLIVRTAGSGTRKTSFARDLRALLDSWNEIETGIREHPAPCRLYHELDLVDRTVRDALTEDVDRILIDDRDVYERAKKMVARVSRGSRNRLKLYDGSQPIFDYFDVQRQLEAIFRRRVWLKSGGCIVFDETEAMVAVDVNTGRHKGGKNQEESIFAVNMEAAEEIARQLRLRNVGGLVVIDFIDMRARKDQNSVLKKLKECLKEDKARTNVLPISQLGLLEMTRQRVAESVRDATYDDCPYCRGRGKVKSPISMSVEIQRHLSEIMKRSRPGREELTLKVAINPAVLERLRKEDEARLMTLEDKYRSHLTFVADPNRHIEEYVIQDMADGKVVYESGD